MHISSLNNGNLTSKGGGGITEWQVLQVKLSGAGGDLAMMKLMGEDQYVSQSHWLKAAQLNEGGGADSSDGETGAGDLVMKVKMDGGSIISPTGS
jgi:hypothetical protein